MSGHANGVCALRTFLLRARKTKIRMPTKHVFSLIANKRLQKDMDKASCFPLEQTGRPLTGVLSIAQPWLVLRVVDRWKECGSLMVIQLTQNERLIQSLLTIAVSGAGAQRTIPLWPTWTRFSCK